MSNYLKQILAAHAEGASLNGAYLRGANLGGADLRDANLRDANLRAANLGDANLRDANLSGADLSDANLRDANLSGADLGGANLSGADLGGANLDGANLYGANLDGADLTRIRADFETVLASAPSEVAGLLAVLKDGCIDGTSYEGECACLVGTLANVRGCLYTSIPGLQPDSERPAERWFLALRPGYTPENHPVAKITAEWIEAWLARQPPA